MEELAGIERANDVKILFAIESGSRAWGFPSPDSDYDARFVYVRNPDWYLSITPGRDVIELPLDEVLDINGWDIKKALGLLLKPNPVLLEWLSSPIRYIWTDDVCEALNSFSKDIAHATACLYHYRSQAAKYWDIYVKDQEQIKLKKYLYILRPAMVIRWIRMNPDIIPPMNFIDLMDGVDLPASIRAQLDEIIVKKSTLKELGFSPRWPDLDVFIQDELTWAFDNTANFKSEKTQKLPEANTLFRTIVRDVWA